MPSSWDIINRRAGRDGAIEITFGRAICGDLDAGLRREWLVTNGLGGYASGTVAGIATRRYHGLLVAALAPPVARTVLVGGAVEWVSYGGQRYALSTHEYGDGTIDPHGYLCLAAFRLEDMVPVWTFALGDALLERRIWMAAGANATYVTYRLIRAGEPANLEITPLVTYRDFHSLRSGQGWRPMAVPVTQGVEVQAFDGAAPFRLLMDQGRFNVTGEWYWNFHHRAETERGLDDRSDLFAPGQFAVTLNPHGGCTLVITTDEERSVDGEGALARERQRQEDILARAGAAGADLLSRRLVLAADQFLVSRQPPPREAAAAVSPATPGDGFKTVIAGYHWFNDWGRDTMIALPGLTLATGRPDIAATVLRTFARYVRDGLVPNNFPDQTGIIPGYNTADATLWYLHAVKAYHDATGDTALVDELLPLLREIVARHRAGTHYGIAVDPRDGLLRAGEAGVQLTWMDAKVGDWVVTPRIGKPVEINALWYNALRSLGALLETRDGEAARQYGLHAEEVRASFRTRFRRPGEQSLLDVVDGPEGDDAAVRPNQILAVSLPYALLDGTDAAGVVSAVGHVLLTTYGLRSLSPADPSYQGRYGGDQRRRDGAYHQGTAWAWLMGAYAEAHFRVHGDAEAAQSLLAPFADHLTDAGLGTISEIFDGDAPHQPRGCIAQAWSVAEVLRVWRLLADARTRAEQPHS